MPLKSFYKKPIRYHRSKGMFRPLGGKLRRLRRRINNVRKLNQIGFPEKKIYTATISAATIINTGSVSYLSGVAEGDDYTNRTGRKIYVKYLRVRLRMEANSMLANFNHCIRVAIVLDRFGTGTAITLSDIFANSIIEDLPNAANNQRARYQILYDKMHYINNTQTPVGTGLAIKVVDIYKRLNKYITFTGTGQTEEGKNSLYLLMYSEDATNGPEVSGFARIAFTDA